jgi:putative ABC transport system ATP-binding protein
VSLVLQDLRKGFHQGETEIQVLKGITTKIDSGEVVSIVGQSGSGKSTLLSLLSGLERSDAGQISIDNVNLETLSEQQLTQFRARNIAIVFH